MGRGRSKRVVILVLLVLPGLVLAQSPKDSVRTYAQPPVTVSGTRLLPRTAESMGSVVRLEGWSLRRLDGRSLDAVLSDEGGLFIRDIGGPGGVKTVSLRNAPAAQTIVHLNGMRMNHPQNSIVDLGLYPSALFDAVEVVRGGQTSLFGADANAGAIVLGLWPSMEDRMTAGVRTGSFGERGLLLRWDQAAGSSATSVRFGIDRSQGNYPFSWSDAIGSVTRFREGASQRRWHAAASAVIHGLPWGQVEATLLTVSSDRGSPGPVTSGPSTSARLRDNVGHLVVRAVHEGAGASGWEAGVTASFQEETYDELDLPADPPDRFVTRVAGGWFQGRHQFAEGMVAGVGVELSHAELEAQAIAPQTKRWLGGITASIEWRESSRGLRVLPMLRWDVTSDRSPSLGPRIAIDLPLRMDRDLVLRGSVGTGTRMPNFNELYWQPGGDPMLRPERILTADVGIRWRGGRDGGGLLDASVFYADTRDRITGWPPVNLSRTISGGGDVHLAWRTGAVRWWFNGTYALVESKSPSFPGRQVPYVPRWLATTGADLMSGPLRFSPVIRYLSRRFTTMDNLRALSLPPAVRVSVSGDLRFSLLGKSASGGLLVENLLNAQGSSFPGYPLPGRSLVARLAIDLLDSKEQGMTPP